MAIDNLLDQIDSEIARLQQARKLLAGIDVVATAAGRKATKVTAAPKPAKRRRISAAGRKAIAEAQRKRWAAVRSKAKK